MKTTAKGYFLQGLNIVPVHGKQPLVQWTEWQNQRQTDSDFESLSWKEADGFALIGGSALNSGLFVCAIDFDVKNLPSETIAKGKEILGKFPITQTEMTPSGGQHLIYLSHAKPKIVSGYHNKCALELLGENKLIVMAPSKDYRRLNDNSPTEIDNIESMFIGKLQEEGLAELSEICLWFDNRDLRKPYRGKDPPCIEALLQNGVSEGNRNDTAIRLSSYLCNFKQLSKDVILRKIRDWNSSNKPPLADSEIQSILESSLNGKYVYGCKDPIIRRHCNQDKCSLRRRENTNSEKTKYLPFFELPDGCLAEQGYDGKEIYFLVFDPKNNSINRQSEIETGEAIIKPIVNDEVALHLTMLPSNVAEYGNEQRLLEEITTFLNKWHEAPTQRDRKLDALYVMLTYISDLLPRVPYRQMIGALGRGKSAWMETVGSICYRPIRLAGCDTDKAICRRLNIWKGTALIDEADFGRSDLFAFITKILNMGYDRKTGYYQRCDDQDSAKVVTYCVFGPKLLANREPYKDMALESRCIKTVARENNKPMPLFRMDRFSAEALALRNKLTLWRFHKYHETKSRITMLESSDFATKLNIDGVSSRVKEILAPLALVSNDFMVSIPDLANELSDELRSDRDFQLEIEFNEALAKIMGEEKDKSDGSYGSDGPIGSPTQDVPTITDFLKESTEPNPSQKNGECSFHVSLSRIAKRILCNENPEPNELTSLTRSLSNMIRTRLGLKIIQGTGGRRLVEVPEAYIRTVTTSTTATKPKYKIIKIV